MTDIVLPAGSPTTGLDLQRLSEYLRKRIPALSGEMRVEQVAGGQSNPTFLSISRPGGSSCESSLPTSRSRRRMRSTVNTGSNLRLPVHVSLSPT